MRNAAFTLLEICLAVAIGVILLMLAVPSLSGLFSQQRLRETWVKFDGLARQAQSLSLSERRDFVLIWEKDAVVLEPDAPKPEDNGRQWPRLNLSKDEVIGIDRPAALLKKPAGEWVFWRSGTCEPVLISYEGPAGTWSARYEALTARGTILEEQIR